MSPAVESSVIWELYVAFCVHFGEKQQVKASASLQRRLMALIPEKYRGAIKKRNSTHRYWNVEKETAVQVARYLDDRYDFDEDALYCSSLFHDEDTNREFKMASSYFHGRIQVKLSSTARKELEQDGS